MKIKENFLILHLCIECEEEVAKKDPLMVFKFKKEGPFRYWHLECYKRFIEWGEEYLKNQKKYWKS